MTCTPISIDDLPAQFTWELTCTTSPTRTGTRKVISSSAAVTAEPPECRAATTPATESTSFMMTPPWTVPSRFVSWLSMICDNVTRAADVGFPASSPIAEDANRPPRQLVSQPLTGSAIIPILKYVLKYSLDKVFHALADPSRRSMVERLSRGPASVSELAAPLAMSLPAVVQHLQVLEASGLVRSEKVGRVRTCQIESPVVRAAEHWLSERRTTWERRLDRLGEFLAEPSQHPQERE